MEDFGRIHAPFSRAGFTATAIWARNHLGDAFSPCATAVDAIARNHEKYPNETDMMDECDKK